MDKKQIKAFCKKQSVRGLIIFIVVQVLIIASFSFLLIESRPVDLKDTKQLDIVVESIDYKRVISEYRMDIYSDSVRYSFNSRPTFSECSVSELYDKIKVGDRLSVIFFEKNSIFRRQKLSNAVRRTKEKTFRILGISNLRKVDAMMIESVLFPDLQAIRPGCFCTRCGSECYPPTFFCLRCDRRKP